MSYEEEDTCHMGRRIHVIWGGGYMSYEEDTCHMRRRIHVEDAKGGGGEFMLRQHRHRGLDDTCNTYVSFQITRRTTPTQ